MIFDAFSLPSSSFSLTKNDSCPSASLVSILVAIVNEPVDPVIGRYAAVEESGGGVTKSESLVDWCSI